MENLLSVDISRDSKIFGEYPRVSKGLYPDEHGGNEQEGWESLAFQILEYLDVDRFFDTEALPPYDEKSKSWLDLVHSRFDPEVKHCIQIWDSCPSQEHRFTIGNQTLLIQEYESCEMVETDQRLETFFDICRWGKDRARTRMISDSFLKSSIANWIGIDRLHFALKDSQSVFNWLQLLLEPWGTVNMIFTMHYMQEKNWYPPALLLRATWPDPRIWTYSQRKYTVHGIKYYIPGFYPPLDGEKKYDLGLNAYVQCFLDKQSDCYQENIVGKIFPNSSTTWTESLLRPYLSDNEHRWLFPIRLTDFEIAANAILPKITFLPSGQKIKYEVINFALIDQLIQEVRLNPMDTLSRIQQIQRKGNPELKELLISDIGRLDRHITRNYIGRYLMDRSHIMAFWYSDTGLRETCIKNGVTLKEITEYHYATQWNLNIHSWDFSKKYSCGSKREHEDDSDSDPWLISRNWKISRLRVVK